MSIESLKKDIEELCNNPAIKLKGIDFDINYIKEQIKICSDSIDKGNWIGYYDNLQVRKENLKELKSELQKHVNSRKEMV